MPKPAYRPLFPANTFADLELATLDQVLVAEVDTPQRRRLISQLRLFVAYLQRLGLSSFELWINGSFTTRKPNPMDIDVVCFVSRMQLYQLTDEALAELTRLGSEEGRPYVREKWNIDLYFAKHDSIGERNSWKAKFSKDEYGEAKGIGRIKI